MSFRDEKIIEQVKELAARFFSLESNRTSLITVTSAALTDNGKEATIFFTVLPESEEENVLEFAKRKRSDFKAFVKEESRLGRIPFFDFKIDKGEKNRQRIDDLSNAG
jgi:ribosome-binding factor A